MAIGVLHRLHKVDYDSEYARMPDVDRALESAILGYLAECPLACDSTRGIAEWWVMQYTVRFSVETVSRALDRLTTAGLLERVESVPEPLYRLKLVQ